MRTHIVQQPHTVAAPYGVLIKSLRVLINAVKSTDNFIKATDNAVKATETAIKVSDKIMLRGLLQAGRAAAHEDSTCTPATHSVRRKYVAARSPPSCRLRAL